MIVSLGTESVDASGDSTVAGAVRGESSDSLDQFEIEVGTQAVEHVVGAAVLVVILQRHAPAFVH